MSTQSPISDLGLAAVAAQQFSAGVARTLARGIGSHRTPPQGMRSPFTPFGGIASPEAFPLDAGSALSPTSVDNGGPASEQAGPRFAADTGADDRRGTRRSPSQLAAVLARAIAQGQRNL